MNSVVKPLLIGLGLLGILLGPKYIEYRGAWQSSTEFFAEADARNADAKVVRSTFELTNPFSWRQGVPTFIAARRSVVETKYLVMYASSEGDGWHTNKALIDAQCAERTMRLVTQSRYEAYLKASGYDVLGNRLPPWPDADYGAMLAAMTGTRSEPAGDNLLFEVACKWDKIPSRIEPS